MKKPNSKLLVISCLLAVIVFGIAGLELTDITHFFHKHKTIQTLTRTPTTGGASANNPKGENQASQMGTASGAPQPGDNKNIVSGGANSTPLSPGGEFVSNHHPSLSGTSSPNTVTSVCTTTPGAFCVISFTKDGVTKSLPAQVTDRAGSAYWNWRLQDIGLVTGMWKIQASASLNGSTSYANDPLNLVVEQ